MAALSAFALSVLSVEQALDREYQFTLVNTPDTMAEAATALSPLAQRPTRNRRITSHYNSFQTICSPDNSAPPSYATIRRRPSIPRETNVLPPYSCTVAAEAKVLLNLELINPMHIVSESEWREVYVVVCGTMISIHRVKDGNKGKLLRTYTLQHAEIGLATDSSHTVLTPNTKLAHLIPGPARHKAYQKDNRLFKAEKQHILRIRLETDQLLFANPSERVIHDLLNTISAGIDIAQPIDDRSATRQCTVPRRRRRNRQQANADITDPTLIADQERILRQMYPTLAENRAEPGTPVVEIQENSVPEEDEVDTGAMREELRTTEEVSEGSTQRPGFSRSTTGASVSSRQLIDEMYARNPANFGEDGKWQPPHTRTEAQNLRYARRCMPVLLADAVRASDVLYCGGRRVKINWRTEMLDEWQLKPPSYKAHNFPHARPAPLGRTTSTSSHASSSAQHESADEITPAENRMSGLDLTKTISAVDKLGLSDSIARNRYRAVENSMSAMHGVVYCF